MTIIAAINTLVGAAEALNATGHAKQTPQLSGFYSLSAEQETSRVNAVTLIHGVPGTKPVEKQIPEDIRINF